MSVLVHYLPIVDGIYVISIWRRAHLVKKVQKAQKAPFHFLSPGIVFIFGRIYNSMRHVKLFEAFSASTSPTEDQIGWLNSCTAGSWKLNHATGLIDVDGGFYCGQQDLTDFKGVAFGHVRGYFSCNFNQLTSLEGAPQTVGLYFRCDNNELTSLEGSPLTVNGNFYCHDNELTSLEGAAPLTVGGGFNCDDNQLTSLEGAPQTVRMNFNCHNNPVSEETLSSIFSLMKKGKSYQQALEKCWPNMNNEDRALMYKQMPNLPPEEVRKYQALARVSRIKGYL